MSSSQDSETLVPCETPSQSEAYLDGGLWEAAYVSRLLDWATRPDLRPVEAAILLGFSARTLDGIVARRGLRPHTEGTVIHPGELEAIRDLEARQQAVHASLLRSLEDAGVFVAEAGALGAWDRAEARARFDRDVFPLITPQTSSPSHPFPVVSSGSLNLLVPYRSARGERLEWARIKVPGAAGASRFLSLEGGSVLVPMESVVADNLDLLFPGAILESPAPFRVTRHSAAHPPVREGRSCRPVAPAARLEVTPAMSASDRGELALHLGLGLEQVSEVAFLGLCDWEPAADLLAFLG